MKINKKPHTLKELKQFELTYIIDNQGQEERLEKLAKRYETINGWSEKDMLQFAVNAMTQTKVYLDFLEIKAEEMEAMN